MFVYVINLDGKPIMPCRPAKARHLLRDKKARVVKRKPFTIQLNWQCEGKTQPVTVGVDKGSHTTGFSAVANGKVLLSGHINHRRDIKQKMDARREHRRSRRSRKWHRPPRFDNRSSSKRSGRLPPSVRANAEEVYRVVRKLPLPITKIVVEDVQVDIARLNDPTLEGVAYQKTNRLGENLRLACLMRDDFTCRICHAKDCRMEAHHIVPRSEGGKDTIKNLATLCDKCHDDLHAGKVTLDLVGENGFKDRMAQRTMQGKAHLYALLGIIAPVSKVFGYQTHAYRKSLDLKKDHHVDALCVATLDTGEVIQPDTANFYNVSFLPRQTRQQYHGLPQKAKGRVRYQVNDELSGFRKGDIVLVRGKWEKRVWSIYSGGYLAFPRVKGEPTSSVPSRCQLLEKAKTMYFETPRETTNNGAPQDATGIGN